MEAEDEEKSWKLLQNKILGDDSGMLEMNIIWYIKIKYVQNSQDSTI